MDERKSARVRFVDYAKAFDHVDHLTVIRKLAALGVPHILFRWLHSFLTNRQQRVTIINFFFQAGPVQMAGCRKEPGWALMYFCH